MTTEFSNIPRREHLTTEKHIPRLEHVFTWEASTKDRGELGTRQ
jgi:hypothetical protein